MLFDGPITVEYSGSKITSNVDGLQSKCERWKYLCWDWQWCEKKPVHFVNKRFIDSPHVQQYNSPFHALFHAYVRMPSKGYGYRTLSTREANEIDTVHTMYYNDVPRSSTAVLCQHIVKYFENIPFSTISYTTHSKWTLPEISYLLFASKRKPFI